MSCKQQRSTTKFGRAASHNPMWRILSTLELFKPDKDVAITPNEDMKQATLAKHHARSLEIALPGRCLFECGGSGAKVNHGAEAPKQRLHCYTAASHLATLPPYLFPSLGKTPLSLWLMASIACTPRESSAILRLNLSQFARRVGRERQHYGDDVLSIEDQWIYDVPTRKLHEL